MASRRIGIFGGSFDPPHNAHFLCARIVAESLDLNSILVIPTAVQPHKPDGAHVPAELRWRMVCAAIVNDSLFCPDRIEIDRGGVSYTIETLEVLASRYPSPANELFLIIGSDALCEIYSWREPERIMSLARIVVMIRPGFSKDKIPPKWIDRVVMVEVPLLDISASWIRTRIAEGKSIRGAVPDTVAEIIERENPYQINYVREKRNKP